MPRIELEDLTIEQLEETIENAHELLAKKKREARELAITEARAILEKAGVSPQELIRKPAKSGRATPDSELKPGMEYVNPNNKKQTYTVGRGRKPQWLKDLRAQGKMPNTH